MDVILQNYKNLIEKIIKDTVLNNIDNTLNQFQGYNINNYINLMSTFYKTLTECLNSLLLI